MEAIFASSIYVDPKTRIVIFVVGYIAICFILQQSDYRIIIGIMWGSDRRIMMCYAHKLGYLSENRIWIFEEEGKFWEIPQWGTEKINSDCSPEQILSASRGMFTMVTESQAQDDAMLVTGEVILQS